MPWINTSNLSERDDKNAERVNQIYNGLDCCVTLEVWHRLREELELRPNCMDQFRFKMALLAPLIEMALRGVLVNTESRDEAVGYLSSSIAAMQKNLDTLATAVWGKGLNPNSPKQLQEFFYGRMKLPVLYSFFKGKRSISTDRKALEKIGLYFFPQIFVSHISKIREARKLLGVFNSGIDFDKRMRCSYNAGGTTTTRLSSNKNVFGGGTNLQNITARIRQVFQADKGKRMYGGDLEQAESRAVGGIMIRDFSDHAYHSACNDGDLHTNVCKQIWPELPWSGDPKRDREIADQGFYLELSYRDLGKRGGHGTNYYGTPRTMAKHLNVEEKIIQKFQENYFAAYHLHRWHKLCAQKLMTTQMIVTPFGTENIFFDRPEDDATLRFYIAYEPQSTVGQLTNIGLLRIWHTMPEVALTFQVHDAIYFQADESLDQADLIKRARACMEVPIKYGSETVIIPTEFKTGFNWGNFDPRKPNNNPNGLMKWKGNDERKRQQGRLDQFLSTIHLTPAKP